MTTISREYWKFYLEGRQERKLLTTAEDEAASNRPELIVASILTGAALRSAITDAVSKVGAAHENGRTKTTWMRKHKDELEDGVDPDLAYKAWLQGRVDELAYAMEEEVVEELQSQVFGEDDEAGDQ